MLSKEFQQKIYDVYKGNHNKMVAHGQYCYSIAHNACASIHTWVIRRKRGRFYENCGWMWVQPLDSSIK